MVRFLKNLVICLAVTSFSLVGWSFLQGEDTFAVPCDVDQSMLLGIPTWYKYLDGELVDQVGFSGTISGTVCQPSITTKSGEKIPRTDILLIMAAILEILVRVAGLAAFIYLIYGGFMYLTSSGNAEQVSKAGTTLLNAAIGLAIAISATTLINFFAKELTK